MRFHEVRSIEIEASYNEVFSFIADPANLPKWAHAFESVANSRARLRTPNGVADVELAVQTSVEVGTIDWTLTFPDRSVATAQSRVTRAPGSRVVYTFVLNAPPVPLEEIEGALSQQVQTLESELQKLKQVIERR
jgi:uncharacterized protein YndB with AHSA1/START domain